MLETVKSITECNSLIESVKKGSTLIDQIHWYSTWIGYHLVRSECEKNGSSVGKSINTLIETYPQSAQEMSERIGENIEAKANYK